MVIRNLTFFDLLKIFHNYILAISTLNAVLYRDDTLLVPTGSEAVLEPTMDSLSLSCSMDPANKKRPHS